MKIIFIEVNEDGARPPLQTWDNSNLPDGYAWCPDEFVDVFYSTTPSGFVNITVENDIVTEMTVNQEALNAYIAEHPDEPEPVEPTSEDDSSVWDALDAAYQEGVDSV